METFYQYDPDAYGSKGFVYIGDDIIVYRRDNNTDVYPFYIDLPGGGPEANETPFETFKREVNEEFGLTIDRSDITYVKRYESQTERGKFSYFPVAKLPAEQYRNIRFGDEGIEYMLVSPEVFIHLADAWPMLQERAVEYLHTL